MEEVRNEVSWSEKSVWRDKQKNFKVLLIGLSSNHVLNKEHIIWDYMWIIICTPDGLENR